MEWKGMRNGMNINGIVTKEWVGIRNGMNIEE